MFEPSQWLLYMICKNNLYLMFTKRDWIKLILEAECHSATYLLYDRLTKKNSKTNNCPEYLLEQLHSYYLLNGQRNVILLRQAAGIIKLLNSHGVNALVLKGAALVEIAYEDLGQRKIGDLDLLIDFDDAQRAVEILSSHNMVTSVCTNRAIFTEHHHLPVMYAKNGLAIELHWSIFPVCMIKEADGKEITKKIMAEARSFKLNGIEAKTLSIEHMIIHLCVHAAGQHLCNEGIMKFYDISQLLAISGDHIDWCKLYEDSEEFGVIKAVILGLIVSERLLHCCIPKEFKQRAKAYEPSEDIIEWACEKVLSHRLPRRLRDAVRIERVMKVGINHIFTKAVEHIANMPRNKKLSNMPRNKKLSNMPGNKKSSIVIYLLFNAISSLYGFVCVFTRMLSSTGTLRKQVHKDKALVEWFQ